MRLIDADAVIAKMTKPLSTTQAMTYNTVVEMLENAPTAEMSQGKWTNLITMNNTLIYGCCDQCHLPSPVSLYCGYCGAKMTRPYNSDEVVDIIRTITKGQG